MKLFFSSIIAIGFLKEEDGKFSFWIDLLDFDDGESSCSLFCIEKAGDEWFFDLFFIHII